MKISPISSSGLTVGSITAGESHTPMAEKIRALKMNVNVTPGRILEEEVLAAENVPISNTNEGAQTATEENQPLSPQFAALAKQRRAIQVKEKAIEEREKAIAAREAAGTSAVDLSRLKSDPMGVLQDAGVTYDDLTKAIIARQGGYNPDIESLKTEIKTLKEGFDKTLSERDQQQKQQALAEMRREASLVSSQGEEFELVRETKSIPDVMRLIEKTYDDTGEVLDVREALKLVEDDLIEQSLRLARLQKVQSQIMPQTPVPQMPMQQHRPMRTLTNRDTATVPLSRKARALMAFSGTLKK